MLKIKKIETKFDEKVSEHTLYSQDQATTLAVVFPGGNNSCDRPILHYSRNFLILNTIDVLNISYSNLVNSSDSPDKQMKRLTDSIMESLNQIYQDKKYKKIVFISRSAGNIVSNELKINHSLEVDKSIYISPTAEAVKYFNTYPGIIICGTQDTYISNDEIANLQEVYGSNVLVFEEGGHGLENDQMIKTLDFCKTAVLKIMDYLLN